MAQINKTQKRQLSQMKSDIIRGREVERCYREYTPPQIRERRRKYRRAKAPIRFSLDNTIGSIAALDERQSRASVERALELIDLRDVLRSGKVA